MSIALNILDTYYMLGMLEAIVPMPSFLKDRYCTTTAEDMFLGNKVIAEFSDGDRLMAPFVVPRAGDVLTSRHGYELSEFAPPYIAPSRMLTVDDLHKRGFGERILPDTKPAERARRLLARDLKELQNRIARREEWMVAQVMQSNMLTAKEYIDDQNTGEDFDVYFYEKGGSNPSQYTVASTWSSFKAMEADVSAMIDNLGDRGLPATDLIIGSKVAAWMKYDETLLKRMDNRRLDVAHIQEMKMRYPYITYLGSVDFSGTWLDIYVNRETVVDEKGVTTKLWGDKDVMVTAPDSFRLMYATITQMNDAGDYEDFTERRVPKLVLDVPHDTRKLRIAGMPLPVPKNKAPMQVAKNVIA